MIYIKPHLELSFENHFVKSVLNYIWSPSDVGPTLVPPSAGYWEDMGKSGKAQAKEPEVVASNAPPQQHNPHGEGLGKLYVPQLGRLKQSSCCGLCTRILYTILVFFTVLESVAVIAVAVTTALATKIYNDELSGRLVAMIMLAVTAAITISLTIYAVIGAIRKKRSPVRTATVVLVIVAVIQAIILGVSVGVTTDDEVRLGRSLSESFRLARDDNPRHVKIWARTQHELKCCGVYSAEDYRAPNLPNYFAPNVPISCCPAYDPDRSELVQEKERETCKAKKEFYDIGCKNLIIDVFKDTSLSVMAVTVLVIILEILCVLVGMILVVLDRKQKRVLESTLEAVPEVVTTDKNAKPKT